MNIKHVSMFEISFGSDTKKIMLDAVKTTALSIWLVEALNSKGVPSLGFDGHLFIYATGWDDDLGFKISGVNQLINKMAICNLLVNIEKMVEKDLLLEDTYPSWINHPKYSTKESSRYQVKLTKNNVLGFIDTKVNKSILPVGLVKDHFKMYRPVTGKSTDGVYYEFDEVDE